MKLKLPNTFFLGVCLAATTISLPAAASDTTVPKPYKATYGDWTVECSACSEGFEEVRSMCWMTPKSGVLTVFPARNGASGKGYLQWYPPLPDNVRDVKGSITFATQGASATTIPANKVFYAELDGSFFVEAPYYDTIQSAFTKGSTTKATFTSNNNGPSGSKTISLKGFSATLQDLNKQAPRYPQKAMCGQQ